MSPETLEKIWKLSEEVAQREGCMIYDIEFMGRGRERTLRIYIDKKDGSVGVEECSNVSTGINLQLDIEDVVPGGSYNLEVSSPGLERVMKKPWHFQSQIGQRIFLRTNQTFEAFGVQQPSLKKVKQNEVLLNSSSETGIGIKIEDTEYQIPYDCIEKARVVFKLEKGKKR